MSKLPEDLSEEASQDSKYKELRKQYGEAEYRYQVQGFDSVHLFSLICCIAGGRGQAEGDTI
jgi:hypothetical protein